TGFRVLVCSGDSYGGINSGSLGLCRLYTEGNYSFVGADLNDQISLVAVGTAKTPSSGTPLVARGDAKLGGPFELFGMGCYEAQRGELGRLPNDTLSSLSITDDVQVIACEHDGYGGRTNGGNVGLCRLYGKGDQNFVGADMNDKTSMLIVGR